jgi:hypothetical protein
MNEISKNTISSSEKKIKINSLNSGLQLGNSSQRKDAFGNPISKKVKNHKISFADQIDTKEKKFIEIKLVSSYREYNKVEEGGGKIYKFIYI